MNKPVQPAVSHQPVEPDTPFEVPPEDGKTPLKLPHENDQDTDMTDDVPDPQILQAYKDLKRGLVDTDMRATPGQDADQRAKDVPGAGGQHPPQEENSVPRR
jgi:nitrogen fixation protein FixH